MIALVQNKHMMMIMLQMAFNAHPMAILVGQWAWDLGYLQFQFIMFESSMQMKGYSMSAMSHAANM